MCLNRVQDGFLSPYLFAMESGDTIDMTGPLGYFVWRQPVRGSILVATLAAVVLLFVYRLITGGRRTV